MADKSNKKLKTLKNTLALEELALKDIKHQKVTNSKATIDSDYVIQYCLIETINTLSKDTQYEEICKQITKVAEELLEGD